MTIDYSKKIILERDGRMIVSLTNGYDCRIDPIEYPVEFGEVQGKISDGSITVQLEPLPPPPSPEQLADAEIASLKAYLASTDWYIVRMMDTGEPVPDSVREERAKARARIDDLKNV